MLGSDPLEELAIPDGTHVQEHDLVTEGDVLVGGQSDVELGVRGGNVIAGERVTFGGDIEADGDCRLDMWCDVDGNVLVGQDAYLGERVHITGQLIVSGDLDIGDDVDIERGFEANGWIVIRNPMPTIVFLFVYLSQLLRIGEEEAAEEVAEEFLADDREVDPVVIPRGANVSDDAWRVSTPATVGDDCRMHGNVRATDIEVGADTEIFGSLRAKEDIRVGAGTVVHGDVTTKGGDVVVAPDAHVRGDISCEDCDLSEAAEVDGAIRARGETNVTAVTEGADSRRDDGPGAVDDASTDGASADDAPRDETAPEAAVVPLGEGDLDVETTPAVVPLAESDVDWDAVGAAATNGDGDVEGVIAEAEKQ
ncbi:polymer-forming cytoskeletal protein [Natronomonas marina]|uniref:polymer-forming cytoskeletal protein n=1 Tax=Natronomonas marina TaxID=2961939 RepID=UPI0020C9BB9A|nr:polymer-forming cytoskeletal protein [Natronomonas marina]